MELEKFVDKKLKKEAILLSIKLINSDKNFYSN